MTEPPELIAGRYRVEREVGRGGMGSVWLCRDEVLGREVAVKLVGHLPGQSVPDLARAMREARSSAVLNHRHVVAIYDVIEEGDHIWLVMEYVPGRTLAEMVAQDGALSPGRVARIGADVADGLAAAHERGTVHRDVKPSNILVTADDVAKISDFGIARTTGDDTLTQSGAVMGTPAYFSPSLARGTDPSPADDVWALGAALFLAVEGRPPYDERPNALATLDAIASSSPAEPRKAEFLTGPLARMLDPDLSSRWDMGQVRQTLRRLAEQHDPHGTRQSRTAAPAAAETATSPEPVAVPAPAPAPAPAPVPAPSLPRRSGGRRVGLLVLALALLIGVGLGAVLLAGRGGPDPSANGTTGDTSATPRTSDQPSPSGSSSDTSSPPAEAGADASAASGPRFVEGYYAMLPGETDRAWDLLTPGFQREVGRSSFDGFWSTIDSVSVDDSSPSGPGLVDVTLTYTTNDGRTESEVREIELAQSGDTYRISGDRVVG